MDHDELVQFSMMLFEDYSSSVLASEWAKGHLLEPSQLLEAQGPMVLLHVLYIALKMATNLPVMYLNLREIAFRMGAFDELFDQHVLDQQREHEHGQFHENHIMEHLRGRLTRVTPYRLISQISTAMHLGDVLPGP